MWRWHSTQRRRRCQLRSSSEPRSPRRMFQRLEVALVEAGLQRHDRLQVRLRLGRRRLANSISRFPSAVLQATHDFTWLKSTLPATSCSALRYISCLVHDTQQAVDDNYSVSHYNSLRRTLADCAQIHVIVISTSLVLKRTKNRRRGCNGLYSGLRRESCRELCSK